MNETVLTAIIAVGTSVSILAARHGQDLDCVDFWRSSIASGEAWIDRLVGSIKCQSPTARMGFAVVTILFCVGWVEGFEPSATGTTIRRSTKLSYAHRKD